MKFEGNNNEALYYLLYKTIRIFFFLYKNKKRNTKYKIIPACYSLPEKSSTSCAWTAWLKRRSRFQIRRWRGSGGTQRRGKDLECLASLERRRDATLMRSVARWAARPKEKKKKKRTLQLLLPLAERDEEESCPRIGQRDSVGTLSPH